MDSTILVLVSGEALTDGRSSTFKEQRQNARAFGEGLIPILKSKTNLAILHGNKPQVGFVLLRSEVATHVLHPIPLDVCGADTQGATGYMLSQALMNVLEHEKLDRPVMNILTQTLMEPGNLAQAPLKAIGPWFDREKAEQYRQARGWQIVEEPGKGYRRGVPTLLPQKVLEIEGIKKLVNGGDIVIAAGGGGIPVMLDDDGDLEGIEVVVETEMVASMVAQQIKANILVMVIDRDDKFILSGLTMRNINFLSLEELDQLLAQETLRSGTVRRLLIAASEFLHHGGEQVMISSLKNLSDYLTKRQGLRVGLRQTSVELFNV
jgi:carbamate kinase